VAITDKSGTAGISRWLNSHLRLDGENAIDKKHPGVAGMHREILRLYETGRETSISNEELAKLARKHLPEFFVSEFDRIKFREKKYAFSLLDRFLENPKIKSMLPAEQEVLLQELVDEFPFVSFAYVVDINGDKVTKHVTHLSDRSKYDRHLIDRNYADRDWFINVVKTGKIYVSDIFTSKITGSLMITVSGPISDDNDNLVGVLGLDIRFEDVAKIDEMEVNGNREEA